MSNEFLACIEDNLLGFFSGSGNQGAAILEIRCTSEKKGGGLGENMLVIPRKGVTTVN